MLNSIKLKDEDGNETEYIRKDSIKEQPEMSEDHYIVRTYSAGVFFGHIKSRNGKEVEMTNARRLWMWTGAASLSQLAMEGTSKPKECKFPIAVAELILTEVIEIDKCSAKAVKSINGVEIWKQ